MQTINLKQYYPFCKEDIFVEVSDEIVEAFLLDKRAEAARDRKMFRYKAFYSLDCNDGIENAAIGWAQPSPEDYLIGKEELAEYDELIRRLYEAISSLPPMQSCSSTMLMLGNAGAGALGASTYPCEDRDMLAAEAAYCALEDDLQHYLDTYESTHDYDEYHFDLDEIEHDPYVLLSLLCALHEGQWTIEEVQGTLQMLFDRQYILTEDVVVETRYRTETDTWLISTLVMKSLSITMVTLQRAIHYRSIRCMRFL